MEILMRSVFALAIMLIGVGLYWGWNRWRLTRIHRQGNVLPGLESWRAGTPAILYFSTPDCVQCRTLQKPALEELTRENHNNMQIISVDASQQPRVADYWAVLSVPTTFVIDAQGRPRRVNNGVASADDLRQQLEETRNGHRS